MKPVIWAIYLWVHCGPYWKICGIYPHDLRNTRFATTSNDQIGQEENKIPPPFREMVQWGSHVYESNVPQRVPVLMSHCVQLWDTPPVSWQPLADMSLPAISKSVKPPKYRVAIHSTIGQRSHWEPQCLPALMKNVLTAIDELSIFLIHHMKCISPPGSAALLALSQSTGDQWGVQCPSVSERVVFHLRSSILTTSVLLKALESESSSTL